uniref:SEC10/PgrA surface exclusion domain-containing protein n=1 Tax=Limosilactobacillus coleohominis TaxID=181675 RepID=UPI0026F0BBA7
NDQQNVVNDAKSEEQNASNAVDNAQNAVNEAQQKVNEATPEKINEAQQKVNDQQNKITKDQKGIDQANQDVTSATNAVSKANQDVTDAQNTVDHQTEAVKDAQTNLSNAQDILNNSNSGKAQKDYDDATKVVNDDQQKVNDQQSVVNNAQSAKTSADQALSDAKEAQSNAQSNFNSKSDDATTAQINYNNAQSATKEAQSKVDQINDELASVNTITLPSGYKEAYEAYENAIINHASNDELKRLSKNITSIGKAGLQNNAYKDQKDDESITVNYSNLTTDQKKALSIFAATLVNQINSQMGTNSVSVTSLSVENASNVVKQAYNDPSWDAFGEHMIDGKGHNNDALQKIADQGIGNAENIAGSLENWGINDDGSFYKLPIDGNLTMNDLKRAIYNDILRMMFADAGSGWGHATNFIESDKYQLTRGNITLGVDYDKYGYSHFELSQGTNQNHLSDNAYILPSTENLVNELATAKNNLVDKQNEETQAKTANDSAQVALSNAKSALDGANAKVTNAQNQADTANEKLNNATTVLNNLEDQLTSDTNKQASAKQTLDLYKADLATKQANVEAAQTKVQTEEAALKEANDTLSNKKQALTAAQNNLNDKQKAVTDAKKQLDDDKNALLSLQSALADLQNSPKVLAEKQADLTNKQAALQAAQTKVQTEQAALDSLNSELQTAQNAKTDAEKAYNDALTALETAQSALTTAKNNLWNDAKIYGDQAKVDDITIHAGDQVDAPKLNNTFGDEKLSDNERTPELFVVLPTTQDGVSTTVRTWDGNLPTGTTAAWLNQSQVNSDAHVVGDHTETVRVTFPDGSTYDLQVVLHVLANPKSQPTISLPNGYRIVGNQVIDANGNPVSGWIVKNGLVYDAQGRLVANLSVNSNNGNVAVISNDAKSTKKSKKELPQTGNENSFATAVLGLLSASMVAVLGLRKRN